MVTIEEIEQSWTFVMVLYRLYKDVAKNVLLNYLNGKIFYDDGYSYTSIRKEFLGVVGLDVKKTGQLWFDALYGWSSIGTFNKWIKITYQPVEKKNLKEAMMSYFTLTGEQMEKLTGEESFLKKKIDLWLPHIQTAFKDKCGKPECTNEDLAFIQWGSKDVTGDIGKPDVVRGYAQ
jgi:hypothetical protein